ncbi:MAG: hypothetical protein M1830_001505 [Pleopsidium flavum]|nr:MAG: hypothetical protein M1830_001505 [Pleopsidium flavum]
MENSFSPGHSSAEEVEDESFIMQKGSWQRKQSYDPEQMSPTFDSSAASSSQLPKVPLPMQKRRRVTRACDECRRKKIKCDGKQPCTHCTVYSYDCTYDQPSNRRRNPVPQYIEALENRLQRAEALLKTVLPDVDLNDPNFDAGVPQRMRVPVKPEDKTKGHTSAGSETSWDKSELGGDVEKDSLLESMVENTGSLDLDDRGHWDFRGHSSGLVFLRRMREQFGDLMGSTEGRAAVFLKPGAHSQVFDSPKSSADSPMDTNLPNTHDLPSRDCAKQLCANALTDACALMRFAHQPTFYALLDRIYNTPPENFGNEENSFLPLLYVVLALGCLFDKDEHSNLEQKGYESAIDQGYVSVPAIISLEADNDLSVKFFKISRQMMDITDCRDLTSLQAVLFMILFLQSSAKLSTCYSYIGIALRSSLRMGLHRSVSINFNPVERETRRRIFWVVRKMDIYVGALLGLPTMLSDDDIDQDFPLEIDDQYVSTERALPMPAGQISLFAATNAHTRILKILAKVMKYIYPIKGLGDNAHGRSNQSYLVSHTKIREIEQDLQEWMENLPMALRPGGDAPPEMARVQQLLRIAYAHVQMMLYRPFLHYVSQSCQTRPVDKRSYACAAACVSVSRNVVHITGEMKKRGLLIGAYWFTMYTTFFAILSLIFFVLENPDSATSHDILRDANEGKETLASLSRRSMAADRCTVMLAGLFDQFPEKLKRSRFNSLTGKKKRQASSPNRVAPMQAIHSAPDIPRQINADTSTNMQRASTFPTKVNAPALKRAAVPYDISTLRQNLNPTFDNGYSRSSHDIYTPTDNMDMPTPDSANSSIPSSAAQQQQFGFPQSLDGSGLPDLSAMMFPSADPFAYPNQPMITLENRQYKQENPPFSPSNAQNNRIFYPSGSPPNPSTPYDSLEVQPFGPLPPYTMQGHHPSMGLSSMGGQIDMSARGGDGMMGMDLDGVDGRWAQQNERAGGTPGMNFEEIFGEEWAAGWMNHGFRQP